MKHVPLIAAIFISSTCWTSEGLENVTIQCMVNDLQQMYINVSVQRNTHNTTTPAEKYILEKKLSWGNWERMAVCRQSNSRGVLSVKCRGWKSADNFYYKLRMLNTVTNESINIQRIWNPARESFYCFADHLPKILNMFGEVKKIIVTWYINTWDNYYVSVTQVIVSLQNQVVRMVNITKFCSLPAGCFEVVENLQECKTYTVCVRLNFMNQSPAQTACQSTSTYCAQSYKVEKTVISATIVASSALFIWILIYLIKYRA